ncbi:hypothetical protein J2X72_002640 [Phyllobacterium sp. 1468]|nr:hypothetical protein [Phyllobacterium sp. 1468]
MTEMEPQADCPLLNGKLAKAVVANVIKPKRDDSPISRGTPFVN